MKQFETLLTTILVVALPIDAAAEEILSARDCPVVFGDDEDVAANQEYRTASLNFIWDGEPQVVIDHSSDWDTPVLTAIRHMELIETSTEGAEAFISFDAEAEGIDCESGVYALAVDDAIGEDGLVLAVLGHILLLEMDGELQYLLEDGAMTPDWRVTWSSSYSMTPYLSKKGTRLRKRRARRKARRRRRRR